MKKLLFACCLALVFFSGCSEPAVAPAPPDESAADVVETTVVATTALA